MASEPTGETPVYKSPDAPLDERVRDLISRMTLEQKVSQLYNSAKPEERAHSWRPALGWTGRYMAMETQTGREPVCLCWTTAIPELDVPAYEWWNECCHGCASCWTATVFPHAIGMAAAWSPELLARVGTACSDEARAKHHENLRTGAVEPHTGLTYWSPNINIFRDPRWGRGQETYGEDPYLTARLAVAFVSALQGDDPRYLKVAATPKHFAVHSGPEKQRHRVDAQVGARDLHDTYLPAFRACVEEAKAEIVMGAYNRVNGEPCCASPTLLDDTLRRDWGFDGHVVSDCGAISDIHRDHRVVETPAEAAALAVRNGCDLECGDVYAHLVEAVERGLISEKEIDRALARVFRTRFRLGLFDPPKVVPYAQISPDVIACDAHEQLAREVARQSIVLLKNENDVLPLSKDLGSVAVIGPNADDAEALLGNYNGTPPHMVTPLEGIKRAVSPSTRVVYARGCGRSSSAADGFEEAVAAARDADVAVVVLGLSASMEGEQEQAWESEVGDDRADIVLPGVQEELLKAVHAAGKPVVLVLVTGSALAVNWADEHVPAIINAWYPAQEGGRAIADVLFGDYNPAGRLPVTFYRSVEDLPEFTDYSMENRTYRFFRGDPLYPFGHGLSYTRFEYSDLRLSAEQVPAGDALGVSVSVTNAGDGDGDEVVQLYLTDLEASSSVPIRSLQGFRRVHLASGETQSVRFTLAPGQMALVDDEGARLVEPGEFEIAVGGGQPGSRSATDGRNLLRARFTVVGKVTRVK